jgi:hypothetical protein
MLTTLANDADDPAGKLPPVVFSVYEIVLEGQGPGTFRVRSVQESSVHNRDRDLASSYSMILLLVFQGSQGPGLGC